jgi:hypothetical protein
MSQTFKSNTEIYTIYTFIKENDSNLVRIYPANSKINYYWGDLALIGVSMIALNFQLMDVDNLAYQTFFSQSHYIEKLDISEFKITNGGVFNLKSYKSTILSNSDKNIKFTITDTVDNSNTILQITKMYNYFFKDNTTELPYFTSYPMLNLYIITTTINDTTYTGCIFLNGVSAAGISHKIKFYNLKGSYLTIETIEKCDITTIKTEEFTVTISIFDKDEV